MKDKLLVKALGRCNAHRPPVWLMRQAGRYHRHYQILKKQHSFMELCKRPELSCEVTMGPIEDFDFDAAILFSDLLFPLEAMGMGLKYEVGPQLDWHFQSLEDQKYFYREKDALEKLVFQKEALELIRTKLPEDKGLLGFVGAPWTLFCYATEGSHQGDLALSRAGLKDGRFEVFLEILQPLLLETMCLQASAGPDALVLFDTCAGHLTVQEYATKVVPILQQLLESFRKRFSIPLVYFAKNTGSVYWQFLKDLPINCLAIDWNQDLIETLENWGDRWSIQGNVDPHWLLLETSELEKKLRSFFTRMKTVGHAGWICSLGHGVLPKTPEAHVRLFLKLQREILGS
jgi:uroporphyrinogen decarboxylase